MKGQVFAVEMNRWGDRENHHYILGVYSTIRLACEAGLSHREWRDGKYEPCVVETIVDSGKRTTWAENSDECREILRKLDSGTGGK